MKLYTNSGSLGKMVVYHDGTQDYSGEMTWTHLVAKHFNFEDCNYCMNGCSNHRIARHLLEVDISQYDAFIIGMTPKMRTEYYNGKWIGVRADTTKQELKEQWDLYFRDIYSEEGAVVEEKMHYHLIRLLLKETGKPYIIFDGAAPLTINWKYMSQHDFFYKGHFTPAGHHVMANDIIQRMSSSTPSLAMSDVMQCRPPSQK